MKNVLTIPSIVAGSKNGGGVGGTNNYDDLTNKPAIDGVVLTKNTTKADLGITTGGAEKYGIKGDYASKYGIINAQNGLITYTSDSKEVTVKAGIQLLMPGSDIKTQIGSDIKYTINSTSDVTLFLADGEVKEAEGVYFQTEEPENGQEAYLAWYNPEVGKWQFKSNDDGNVWRTPTKAGPLADVHLSETGVIRVDYVGYRVLNDQIFALKSDLPVNAYTAENLVAGNNITIDEVLPSGKVAINNAITKTSQLTNDSGFLTSVPENLVTTDTYQDITARKTFTEQIDFTSNTRVSSLYSTTNQRIAGSSSGTMLFSSYDQKTEIQASDFNINTANPNAGGQGPATLNGKQIATIDDIAAASSSVASVNTKTGAVVLTGADIQTTYTANPEVTEPTTSDINSAFTQVCEDIHNVLTNVPTGAELMSTSVYAYQAPLATNATLADVIAKVNTILAIMSERGIMEKNS